MIPKEVLEKYGMRTLEEYLAAEDEMVNMEFMFYTDLLARTDHVPLKIFEDYLVFMVENNVNVGSMKKFFNGVEAEYGDVLAARKTAREEINRIEAIIEA